MTSMDPTVSRIGLQLHDRSQWDVPQHQTRVFNSGAYDPYCFASAAPTSASSTSGCVDISSCSAHDRAKACIADGSSLSHSETPPLRSHLCHRPSSLMPSGGTASPFRKRDAAEGRDPGRNE